MLPFVNCLKSDIIVLSEHFSVLLGYVLMSDDLVGNPVENIEDEEGQRKGCPRDCVYPFGSVHKLLLHGVRVFWDRRLRVRSRSSVLNNCAVFRWQAHVVAGEVKAPFMHVIILEREGGHREFTMQVELTKANYT